MGSVPSKGKTGELPASSSGYAPEDVESPPQSPPLPPDVPSGGGPKRRRMVNMPHLARKGVREVVTCMPEAETRAVLDGLPPEFVRHMASSQRISFVATTCACTTPLGMP